MKFKLKGGDKKIYNDPVVGRKLNGYILNHEGEEYFVDTDYVDIFEISEEERNAKLRWP